MWGSLSNPLPNFHNHNFVQVKRESTMKKVILYILIMLICNLALAENKVRKYILAVPTIKEDKYPNQIISIINNARFGEALGFLTENVKNQNELMRLFPKGISDVDKTITGLANKTLKAPYGLHNNNYLTHDKTQLIYSDDSDVAALTYMLINCLSENSLNHPEIFADKLAQALVKHWLAMRDSGDYGADGLYYGKRGYGKLVLQALADLSKKNRNDNASWYIASDKFKENLDNGSLLRAWVIGLHAKLTPTQAYKLGFLQSRITHPDNDVSVSAGALAFVMNKLVAHAYQSKNAVITDLISVISHHMSSSNAVANIQAGIKLAKSKSNPILVYNHIRSSSYDETLELVAYSFLYFDSYTEALRYIVHTPGDNDSVAFITGAVFAAYSGRSVDANLVARVELGEWGTDGLCK